MVGLNVGMLVEGCFDGNELGVVDGHALGDLEEKIMIYPIRNVVFRVINDSMSRQTGKIESVSVFHRKFDVSFQKILSFFCPPTLAKTSPKKQLTTQTAATTNEEDKKGSTTPMKTTMS